MGPCAVSKDNSPRRSQATQRTRGSFPRPASTNKSMFCEPKKRERERERSTAAQDANEKKESIVSNTIFILTRNAPAGSKNGVTCCIMAARYFGGAISTTVFQKRKKEKARKLKDNGNELSVNDGAKKSSKKKIHNE